MLFRRLLLSAILVGSLAGLLLSAIQLWQVIPIIHGAEPFEQARARQLAEPVHETTQARGNVGHAHQVEEWEPAEGAERTGYTLLANVLTAIGFALVMLAAMLASLKRNAAKPDWRYGLFWGAAGYVTFFVAPSLGMLPEIPGAAAAAALGARQLWWVLAVVCTAAGLAAVAFGKTPWRWAAPGLLVVPYLVGAPHPATGPFADYPPSMASELTELARQFVWATALANALYWLVLGGVSAWTVRRFLKESVA